MLQSVRFIVLLGITQILAEVPVQFIENVKDTTVNFGSSRIVSGWEALPGEIPHQVAIRLVSANGAVSSCGGSVIHRQWVLTAAHCTAQQVTLVVRAGLVSLTRPAYIDETTMWYNHPTYNNDLPGVVQPNDISVVQLRNPVTYSPLLKAIKIQPGVDANKDYSATSEVFYTSGFGRTWSEGPTSEVLNWVFLRATSYFNCAYWFGTNLITENSICAEYYNVTSQSTCQGDSGGPLVHVGSDGIPVLVGVTSFVAGGGYGCHSGLPAGFIRPGPFLGWLEEKTGIDFENLDEESEITTVVPTTPEPTTPEPTTPKTTTPEPTTPEPTTPEPTTPEPTTPEPTTPKPTTPEPTTPEPTTPEPTTPEPTTPETTTPEPTTPEPTTPKPTTPEPTTPEPTTPKPTTPEPTPVVPTTLSPTTPEPTTPEPTTPEPPTTITIPGPTTVAIPTTSFPETTTQQQTTTPTTEVTENPDEEEEEDGSSESEEDKELADLMKRLEVQVKVKVKLDKLKKKVKVHEVVEK